MGLAAYGQPHYRRQFAEVLKLQPHGSFKLNLKFFRHHVENVSDGWEDGAPQLGTLYTPELECLLGPPPQPGEPLTQKHKDIAASAQATYEDALFSILNEAHSRFSCFNLALAGGCALNSVANGKIYARTPFKTMYIPPAAGDAGGAIGAALVVWHTSRSPEPGQRTSARGQRTHDVAPSIHDKGHRRAPFGSRIAQPDPRIPDQDHAYAGPHFDNATLESLLRERGLIDHKSHTLAVTTTHDDLDSLCARTAEAIAAGKVVGWFQGRMEWGPRALGNRSILCDPRRADMKHTLNAKIKRRESFRPFAPSILRAQVAEWFEEDAEVPFMSAVFRVRREKRPLIPAVTHADGSGRLQTVDENTNPLFHRLISEFYALTSVPLILNTSFNEQEPIVCRPQEALDCFLRTKMDVLVLSGFFITRHR
jgi:carbamoyltransferase